MFKKNYNLNPAKFPSAPVLAWQVVLKKWRKKEILTNIVMLLMVTKGN